MELATTLYLPDILHMVSDNLLVPVMVVLIFLLAYALWCIGSILIEALTEHRNYRVSMPKFLHEQASASYEGLPGVIAGSGLLNRQKAALLTVWDYRCLHEDTILALVKRLIACEDQRYGSIVGRQDTATKLGPMFGLMGTLIPLGPGIVALGQGDTSELASSIGVAFDTTVAGLASAAVCFVVGKIRKLWYEDYMSSLESAMTGLLEIIDEMRDTTGIDIDEPTSLAKDMGFARDKHQERAVRQTLSEERDEGARRADEDAGADLGSGAGTAADANATEPLVVDMPATAPLVGDAGAGADTTKPLPVEGGGE